MFLSGEEEREGFFSKFFFFCCHVAPCMTVSLPPAIVLRVSGKELCMIRGNKRWHIVRVLLCLCVFVFVFGFVFFFFSLLEHPFRKAIG